MKLLQALLALVCGYGAATLFFSLLALSGGFLFSHDYWIVLFYIAVFGFSIGALSFLPCYFIIGSSNLFWRWFVGVPIGATIAYLSLFVLYRSLALEILYGGQAVIMGGTTFLIGSLLKIKKESRTSQSRLS